MSTARTVIVELVKRREAPRLSGPRHSDEEADALRSAVDELGERLTRLEEERDFYRHLLEPPTESRSLRPLGSSRTEADAE